jgi:hypothetical protein
MDILFVSRAKVYTLQILNADRELPSCSVHGGLTDEPGVTRARPLVKMSNLEWNITITFGGMYDTRTPPSAKRRTIDTIKLDET